MAHKNRNPLAFAVIRAGTIEARCREVEWALHLAAAMSQASPTELIQVTGINKVSVATYRQGMRVE